VAYLWSAVTADVVIRNERQVFDGSRQVVDLMAQSFGGDFHGTVEPGHAVDDE